MTMAGAKPINWMALTGEWAPYWASPERAAIADVYSQRGGSAGLASDYAMAQIAAGVVPRPGFMSVPAQAS
jgi:hypothetical protein